MLIIEKNKKRPESTIFWITDDAIGKILELFLKLVFPHEKTNYSEKITPLPFIFLDN